MPKKIKIEETSSIAMGIEGATKSCKVFGSDEVLTEKTDIDYYKACIKEFEVHNKLLGSINDEGEYIIEEKVRRDLALMPKEQLSEGYQLVEAYSRILTKDLFFVVEFEEELENGIEQLSASLYVVEKVDGYKNLQSLRSFVARVVQPKGDGFVDKVKKVFNIEKTLKTIDEGKFIDLAVKIQDHLDDWYSLEEIIDLSSQIYVMRMLQLLENEAELGKEIIAQYNREMKYEELDNVSIAKRYMTLRKLLDKVIDEHGGVDKVFKKEENKKEVKVIKNEYSAPVRKVEHYKNKTQQNTGVTAKRAAEAKKAEKAAETPAKKAGGAKKSAGKKPAKKAGGSKPKKDKKKEDKKEDKKKDAKKRGVGKVIGGALAATSKLLLDGVNKAVDIIVKPAPIEVVGGSAMKNPKKEKPVEMDEEAELAEIEGIIGRKAEDAALTKGVNKETEGSVVNQDVGKVVVEKTTEKVIEKEIEIGL